MELESAATVWDMAAQAAVWLTSGVGAYWQLKGRIAEEKAERVRLGDRFDELAKDVGKLSTTQEKLVRREHRREGAAMAARREPSGAHDLPVSRVHVGTDTTL